MNALSQRNRFSLENRVYWLMAVAFLVRICCLPFTQTVDADAVSRVFMAWGWMENMEFIAQGVWLPFHQYLIGIGFWILPDMVLTPKLINLMLFTISVWPFYRFCGMLFNEKSAWLPTLIYVLSPAIMRNGFMAMAGGPYISFVVWPMYFAQKTVLSSQQKHAALAGLFITIAGGFRYEAWVISGLLFWMMALQGQRKTLIIYTLIAVSYPVVWLIGNYIVQGDALHGLNGAYDWNVVRSGVNENVTAFEHLRRILFFPTSLGLTTGYFLAVFTTIGLIWALIKKQLNRKQLLWLLPFLFLLITFIVKADNGTLLLKHRFTITLLIFIIPYSAVLIANQPRWKNVVFGSFAILIFPLSFWMPKANIHYVLYKPNALREAVYQVRDIGLTTAQPIPRLIGTRAESVRDVLLENKQPNDGIILDFFGWDDTYFVALHITEKPSTVFLQNGAVNDEPGWDRMDYFLNQSLETNKEGLIVLNPETKFAYELKAGIIPIPNTEDALHLNKISETEGLTIYRYKFGAKAQREP